MSALTVAFASFSPFVTKLFLAAPDNCLFVAWASHVEFAARHAWLTRIAIAATVTLGVAAHLNMLTVDEAVEI